MKKIALLAAISASFLLADECAVPNIVLEAVANVESGGYAKGGYPYVIGINNKEEIAFVRASLPNLKWLENRSIDCKNKQDCVELSYALIKAGIQNIDLGKYQINHKWHNKYAIAIEDYFEERYAKQIACKAIEECIKSYGYNWYGVSCYHSRTPIKNDKYSEKLDKELSRLSKNSTKQGD